MAGNRARAAMLDKRRRRVAGAAENIWEAFVVPEDNVVARSQLLDEVGLEQERLSLGLGGHEDKRARLRDHPRDPARLALGHHIGGDALLDRARLADIEHLALGADHSIDARPRRRVPPELADRLRSARQAPRL